MFTSTLRRGSAAATRLRVRISRRHGVRKCVRKDRHSGRREGVSQAPQGDQHIIFGIYKYSRELRFLKSIRLLNYLYKDDNKLESAMNLGGR